MKFWKRFTNRLTKSELGAKPLAGQEPPRTSGTENGLKARASRHFLQVCRSTLPNKCSSEVSESDITTTTKDLTLLPAFGFEENVTGNDWVRQSETFLSKKLLMKVQTEFDWETLAATVPLPPDVHLTP